MKYPCFSEDDLRGTVGSELSGLLKSILLGAEIDQHQIHRLARLTDTLKERVGELPAIEHLGGVLRSITADNEIDQFERAMLRACIEKILPEPPCAAPEPERKAITPGLDNTRVTPSEVERWVVIDTETSGLFAPIYAVEIAAQRMCGWKPEGEPFRILLNHDVDLEPAAVATHGYTRDYLRRNGADPQQAHDRLAEYANGLPMVSHNLAYDFNRVLEPEWNRLRRQSICRAGFCTVMLARRCLPEISSASLQSLATQFGLGAPAHQAGRDVAVVVRLISEVLAPRLSRARIHTFSAAQEFSRRTPLGACRKAIAGETEVPNLAPIRRAGPKTRRFLQFVSLLTQDGAISPIEFEALQRWLEIEGCASPEASRAADVVEGILSDGRVTPDELSMLHRELVAMVQR